MAKYRLWAALALGLVTALWVAGCGAGQGGGQGGTGGGAPTVTVVSDLPLQGSSRAQNETIVNAIKLALEQRGNKAGDVNIKYQSLDDATAQAGKWDEAKCTQNAQQAASNQDIVGWIGPFNSGCAAVEIPILNQGGLAMTSPANTYIGLTKPGAAPDEPDKYYPTGKRNYTRVIPADDKQAKAAVTWLKELGVKSVYILDDRETYGKGIADLVEKDAKANGLNVLGRDGIDGKASNYRALMSKIAAMNPDAIYYGGITQNNAGQLVKDKVGAGMPNDKVKFMGPDGIDEQAFADAGGSAAEGVYITFGGLPESELTDKGKKFVQDYKAKYGGNIEAYTAYGYEAANVMFDAVGNAYKADGKVTREGVVKQLFATKDYQGVLGTWSFDKDGDTTLSKFAGYQVKNGKIEFVKTINIGGTQ